MPDFTYTQGPLIGVGEPAPTPNVPDPDVPAEDSAPVDGEDAELAARVPLLDVPEHILPLPRTDVLQHLQETLADVEPGPYELTEPSSLIYLSGVSTPHTRTARLENLGVLAQPGNSVHLDSGRYPYWAADNGCFAEAAGRPWSADAWLTWIVHHVVPRRGNCLFATAPDIVGDAAATLHRSEPYLRVLQKLQLPAALVAQNGLDEFDDRGHLDWDSFDVLFIGGSPQCPRCRWVRPLTVRDPLCPDCRIQVQEWKESEAADRLSRRARDHGKWVHVGRVNSWRRIALVRYQHADSADGTYLSFGPRTNWPKLLAWLRRLSADAAPFQDIRDPHRPIEVIPAAYFCYGSRTREHGTAEYLRHR